MLTIDDREVVQHPEIPAIIGVEHKIERMETSDYAFLGADGLPVGIERCEISNLIQKLRSGELEDQLYRCQESFGTVILLKEGVYDSLGGLLATHRHGNNGYFRDFVYPHTTYEQIKSVELRLSSMGIELIDSPHFTCSIDIIRLIYNQRTKPEEKHTLFKKIRVVKLPTKRTANPMVSKLMSLVSRMPETTAILLIHRFNNIWGVINATDKELMEIDGVGKGLVKRIKESIGKEE